MDPRGVMPDTHRCKKAQAVARAGQAAIELAVFGAILIFILGTIVRSAVGNGYAQNQNFKAMRMAMLASWKGTELGQGAGAFANISRNNASILFVEDRLSPDANKYGVLERNPFIAMGSGTFTYNSFYPWQPDADPIGNMIPIMDVYINGQHFPFTTASYVINRTIYRPGTNEAAPACADPAGSCSQNQCLRNAREWVGGTVTESQFETVIPVTFNAQADANMKKNASDIFNALAKGGLIINVTGTDFIISGESGLTGNAAILGNFNSALAAALPALSPSQLNQVQLILLSDQYQYKLFYTMAVNGSQALPHFSQTPPGTCSGTYNALCSDLVLGNTGNSNGDLMFDLQRNNDPASFVPSGMRAFVA